MVPHSNSRRSLFFCLSVRAILLVVSCLTETTAILANDAVYCGIYSLYGAARVLHQPVEFESLIDAKYIGSPQGSTVNNLVRAGQDIGLECAAFSGLGAETLRTAQCPLILHVAGGEQLRAYNHWILFLGVGDDDRVTMVDPPNGVRKVPLAEILSRWDGVAIFVDRRPVSVFRLRLVDLMIYFGYAIVLVAALLGLVLVSRRMKFVRVDRGTPIGKAVRWGGQTAVIFVLASCGGYALHFADSSGFIRNPGPVSFVAAANMASFIPKLSFNEAHTIHSTGKTVFIDSRYSQDFAYGHVPGAINIPIDVSAEEFAKALSQLSPDNSYVIYCQSSGCRFAEVMATRLLRSGLTKVSLFPGGWVEWRENISPPVKAALR